MGTENGLKPIIEISSSRLLFHHRHGNLIFLLPCSSTTPSLLPFEFVGKLISVLESYLSTPLLVSKIEANYDIVCLVLSEMLDGGAPFITDPDAIHEYVQPLDAIAKFLSSKPTSIASNYTYIENGSDTPWRRSNVKHVKNELFVDIVERINLIVPPTRNISRYSNPTSSSAFYTQTITTQGKPLLSQVDGRIIINSHLSGVPDISLNLANGKQKLLYPAFHPCVRQEEYHDDASTHSLNFIPPDGKFLLASYTAENVDSGLVQAELRTGLGPAKNEFEVRISTLMYKDSESIDSLSVKIVTDKRKVRSIKTLRVSTGDFGLVDGNCGEWRFGKATPLGWNATLRGVLTKLDDEDEISSSLQDASIKDEYVPQSTSLIDSEVVVKPKKKKKSKKKEAPDVEEVPEAVKPSPAATAIFPTHLEISYKVLGYVPSGVKVQALKIKNARRTAEGAKPFKGVRYITITGNYIVR